MARNNVPLTASPLTFQRSAQGGQVRVIADGVQIGPPEVRQEGQPAPTAGSVQINAAPLLRAAMESADAKKEGLADKINPDSLRAPQICELKYDGLGSWSAELTIQDSQEAAGSGEFPMKVVGAKIVMEPATQ